MLLLASRGLFIGLIAVVAIVVILCLVFSFMLYRKTAKVKKTLDADIVRRELYRRETDVVIQLVKENPDESKKEALLNELRRIKSAEMLVEEIVKNEKADRGIAENHAKAPAAPAGTAPTAPRPAAPAGTAPTAPRPAAPAGTAPTAPRPAAPAGTAPTAPRPAAPAGTTPTAPRPAAPAGTTPTAPRPAAPAGTTPTAPRPAAPAGTAGTDKPSEE